jgi:hypothetical protein
MEERPLLHKKRRVVEVAVCQGKPFIQSEFWFTVDLDDVFPFIFHPECVLSPLPAP